MLQSGFSMAVTIAELFYADLLDKIMWSVLDAKRNCQKIILGKNIMIALGQFILKHEHLFFTKNIQDLF